MNVCTIDLQFLIPVGVGLVLVMVVYLGYRESHKSEGRTTRHFRSDGDVWGILELWAGMKNYQLADQGENSRSYLKQGSWFHFLDPRVSISRTTTEYQLDASLFTRRDPFTSFVMMIAPREIALDKAHGWRWKHDQQFIASKDVNVLIEMLNAGIDRIPYLPME